MYRPGKILKSGTWADPDFTGLTVNGRAAVVDAGAFAPAWREIAPMAFPRAYHTLTVLPDGNVLATGGGRASDGVDLGSSVYEAELWNAQTETWSTMAAMQKGRLYHSSALLLPDARVLVAGGGALPSRNAFNQTNAEIYSPPYLFKGPRPTIGSAPGTVEHATSFQVATPDADRIASVALVRFGSVTHNIDMDQRYLPLSFTRGSGSLTVQAPPNANVAPAGQYMLFLVDSAGVPSVSASVRIPLAAGGDTTAPTVSITAPTGGEVSGTVDVTASASDAVGVAGVRFSSTARTSGPKTPPLRTRRPGTRPRPRTASTH